MAYLLCVQHPSGTIQTLSCPSALSRRLVTIALEAQPGVLVDPIVEVELVPTSEERAPIVDVALVPKGGAR